MGALNGTCRNSVFWYCKGKKLVRVSTMRFLIIFPRMQF